MKTKFWIVLIAAIMVLCLASSFLLFRTGAPADTVTVVSDGKVLYTLSLHMDQVLQIAGKNGTNTVTVQGGKVAVTAADCPDGHCMARGFCDSGMQIVCLPNRLVLRFSNNNQIDAISG